MIRGVDTDRRRLAAAIAAASLALVAVALVALAIQVANGWLLLDTPQVTQTYAGVIGLSLTFPLVGWTIVRHAPGNRIGWVYLAIGGFESLNLVAGAYSGLAYWTGSGGAPLAALLSWVALWAWVPAFTLFSTVAILLFPTGRLPSRRWWPVAALAGIALVLSMAPVVAALPYRGVPLEEANALGLPPPSDPFIETALAVQAIGQLVLLVAMVGSVAGMAVRFRRSTGVERLQLKWFTYAAVLTLAIVVAWTAGFLNDPIGGVVSGIVVGVLLPVATAFAILRYRLYDIDRLVSRTIGYAIVSGILGLLFVAIVLLVQALVASLFPEVSETGAPAVVASTLAVAALFQPVRGRVQAAVDRRFDRARFDRDRSVLRLGNRLRDAVELDVIRDDVLGTVNASIRPASLSMWLRRP